MSSTKSDSRHWWNVPFHPVRVTEQQQNKPEWGKTALELLSRQDRFTSAQIIDEFQAKRVSGSTIALNETMRATHVVDDHYAVIWHAQGNQVFVDAVVASPVFSNDPEELKSNLEKSLKFAISGLRPADR